METQFFVESFARFFTYVRITGGLHVPGQTVKSLTVLKSNQPICEGQVNLPMPGFTVNCGFLVTFMCEEFEPKDILLIFELHNGKKFQITGAEAASFYLHHEAAANKAEKKFFERLQAPGYDRVLEIGSRARSGLVRKELFKGKQYTGVDILAGENVDVVGDAHALSTHFAPESFDAIYSVSTFEHLAMPWKVALELNKILRTGGVAYLVTHQALGMHDTPWDFWRYSDTAWDGIFNTYTGFRKQETFLGGPMTLVPAIYHDHWKGFEGAYGFSISAALIEKTGPCNLKWDLDVMQAIQGIYPH
ncbi:MAG TPA: class I SAM-dependent methyltransferase [Bryobacteraceae bacterium]|jgi:SAM-dependent methyltransferase|nr:class I SAM-dependent methyltransferase [Bryobacteraceae bacterium]